jgi:CelD/BcsL family acetyltransferase involved in cellulose biosynthesis
MLPVSDPAVVQTAWQELVQPEYLYDEWRFRQCFLDHDHQRLSVYLDKEMAPDTMLPLQQCKITDELSFIGAPFMERNRGFCRPGFEDKLCNAYLALPQGTVLDDIAPNDPITRSGYCVPGDPAYVLHRDQVGLQQPDSLYRFLPKNIRENLRKTRKKIEAGTLFVEHPSPQEVLKQARALSHERFGDESWLEVPYVVNGFSELFRSGDVFGARMDTVSLVSQNVVVAASISVNYRSTYYMLAAAAKHDPAWSGLGSYLYYTCMLRGFEAGCEQIDTGIGDCGWKERWGLQTIPQFLYSSSPKLAAATQ